MNEYIVGIDIGTSKVCAAAGKLDKHGELQIMGTSFAPCNGLKKGIVVDIDNTAEAIKTCIEQLERMVDIQITSAYISLPGGITELVPSKGVVAVSSEDREIKDSDVERVLNAAKIIHITSDKKIIGVEPEQFVVDGYEVQEPVGMSGIRLEADVNVIIAQTTVVNNLAKSVERAGLKLDGIVLQPTAISKVVLKKEDMEVGTALIDIGAETIDIAVYKSNSLCYTDMIPLGGNTITNDIALCLKIPFSNAEKLKIKYGSVEENVEELDEKIKVNASYNDIIEVDKSMLLDIIKARVEEILGMVLKKLENSGHLREINGVVIVGGGLALLKGIVPLSKEILRKPVKIGVPQYVGAASPIYSVTVGIVKDVINSLKTSYSSEDEDEEGNEAIFKKLFANNKEEMKEESSLFSKIKDFFVEFF